MLKEIGALKETRNIRGVDIHIHGCTFEDLRDLFLRFPKIAPVLSRNMDETELMRTIFEAGPIMLSAFIAAGVGSANDEEAEATIRQLTAGEQTMLLEAVVKATFPQGWGPFVRGLEAIGLDLRSDSNDGKSKADSNTPDKSKPSSTSTKTSDGPGPEPQEKQPDGSSSPVAGKKKSKRATSTLPQSEPTQTESK